MPSLSPFEPAVTIDPLHAIDQRPRFAISMGDPAGVGPEVCLKALSDESTRRLGRWVLVGDASLVPPLQRWGLRPPDQIVNDFSALRDDVEVALLDLGMIGAEEVVWGELSQSCGKAGLAYVKRGVELCLSGDVAGIITAPLNKEAVALGGMQFTGHTEYIADLCGAPDSRMLLVNDQLCVVHVSTHCSLAEAARLDVDRIVRTIELGYEAVARLLNRPPRVAVCGLNPHAGEHGLFGSEESEFIVPAIEQARGRGYSCEGPFPADTLFMLAVRGHWDLLVAMYHDQGHVPMKLLDFEHTANVSLGLPIIRVSVDHGTAFEIAGKNEASAEDMQMVMELAGRMASAGR